MISEDHLIYWIKKKFPKIKHPHFGIGDDAALLNVVGQKNIVISTDSIVEGTHFKKAWSSPEDLAIKSLHMNLSDIAAMGARPEAFFLNLKISPKENVLWLKKYLTELARQSRKNNCPLMGGNIARSNSGFTADIMIVGKLLKDKKKFRNGARAGDLICIGAPLGLSGAGLKILQTAKRSKDADEKFLMQKHLRPEAQIKLGMFLGQEKAITSMMDLSDGLSQDLPKLLKASDCGALIDFSLFPMHESLMRVSQNRDWNPFEVFWLGGEDYKLLFTIKAKDFSKLSTQVSRKNLNIFPIGICTKNKKLELCFAEEKVVINKKAFSHF
ncbi:MAG: thiamine-phosphate kinase [Proteobacteria bacterium]|nr:thiamine-phosphate kinase [Pseudomonadota bacterium]